MKDGLRILNEYNIASYKTPEQAIRAFMNLVEYSKNLKTLYETPRDVPVEFSLDRDEIHKDFIKIVRNNVKMLSEEDSKTFLKGYGIPVSLPRAAANIEDAKLLCHEIGYPVVFKIISPDITHKSDVGGVILDIQNDEQAQEAYESMMKTVKEKAPNAEIEGVTVQPMIKVSDSLELILGIKKDAVFGTVILVGAGGVTAELFVDRSLGIPPLNERLARKMLEDLKIWPLLQGYRGSKPVDLNKLIEIIIRLSYLAADYPEIKELDINPLLVSSERTIALDARILIDKTIEWTKIGKYDHLSIVPYPEAYITQPYSIDGVDITFRPIKPEDEPLWFDLLGSCSKESIYSRFNHFMQWHFHEVATRFCYIDYDREIAIVAEIEEDGKKKLIGVGRLIADVEHKTVEYAILVADKWQNKELGSHLTDYCLEISEKWGLERVVAQTSSDNSRIISMFRKREFEITHDKSTGTVFFEKIV